MQCPSSRGLWNVLCEYRLAESLQLWSEGQRCHVMFREIPHSGSFVENPGWPAI